MSPQPPEPAGRNGGWPGKILGQLLGYADRPWRALFVLVLILVGAIGFAVWSEREAFIKLFAQRQPAPVALRNDGELATAVASIVSDTSADLVFVLAVDLDTDIAEFRVARLRGGGAWELTPRVLSAVHEKSDAAGIGRALRGQIDCRPIARPAGQTGPLLSKLAADGFGFLCVIPVPPDPVDPLIGAVMLAWRNAPPAEVFDAASAVAASRARQMVTR